MNTKILTSIEQEWEQLTAMSDQIFDHPEMAFHEELAASLLADYLELHGFQVQRGVGSLNTAFRAEYQCNSIGAGNNSSGSNTTDSCGPVIGLLCEYDALPAGHACGHQLQGPAIVGAAAAIKALVKDTDYKLVVYGTPAEEGCGGKVTLLEEGFLTDIDVALMMHGGPATQTDVRSMAKISAQVTFCGTSSHAALKPEDGRSALDALLLSFQGIEYLREHVREDTRMHYTITNAGGPCNVVPQTAAGEFSLRSYSSPYLDELIERFENIIKGAALMTGTTSNIDYRMRLEGKIPVHRLNRLMMEHAEQFQAPNRQPDRLKTGSTDFASVMYQLPGACIRIAFVPPGTSSHSQGYLDAGKSQAAHEAIRYGAMILTASSIDLIQKPDLLVEIKKEWKQNKSEI